jgi:hypothetical protein
MGSGDSAPPRHPGQTEAIPGYRDSIFGGSSSSRWRASAKEINWAPLVVGGVWSARRASLSLPTSSASSGLSQRWWVHPLRLVPPKEFSLYAGGPVDSGVPLARRGASLTGGGGGS